MVQKQGFQCYCCKKYVTQDRTHERYPRMCVECGEMNLLMRERQADLSGYVALVTGARIKIGFHTALRLLRDGATVIATTRFPADAARKYAEECDFDTWKDRLFICRLDLLRVDLLTHFSDQLSQLFPSIDIIINNAAQTVRKPESYAFELREQEKALQYPQDIKILDFQSLFDLSGEGKQEQSLMPVAVTDAPLAQVDGSSVNSWIMESGDIGIREFLEVQLINVTAPFILNTKLRPLLAAGTHKNRFIINVSSAEGQFSQKKKSTYHVHTNMGKAALNMMTKTISREYARDRIFVYSVDPGWVSNQFPENWENLKDNQFYAPLHYRDASARLCHPIYQWMDSEKPETGLFLKDYKEIEW